MKKQIEMDEKCTLTKNGSKVLGIQLKCSNHGWQRTVYIGDGIGCSKCYGNKKFKTHRSNPLQVNQE